MRDQKVKSIKMPSVMRKCKNSRWDHKFAMLLVSFSMRGYFNVIKLHEELGYLKLKLFIINELETE